MPSRVIVSGKLDLVLFVFACVLTNATAFSFTPQYFEPAVNLRYGFAIGYLELLVGILVIARLVIAGELSLQCGWMRRHSTLLGFVGFCLLSLLWTIDRRDTGLEASYLLFATLLGAYAARHAGPREGAAWLLAIGGAFAAMSAALLLVSPPFSRLLNHPFYGAWRGAFWHRNHLGSLMAFFSAIGLFWALRPRAGRGAIALGTLLCIGAAILVVGSRSATGALILAGLLAAVLATMAWLRLHSRLRRGHYVGSVAVAALLAWLVFSNLPRLFGALGRDTTLTGRTAIWSDLLARVWPERPFLGYGYGALWNQTSFREEMQAIHGWPYPVFFADNGYLDLLLNLGVIGLVLYLVFFLWTGCQAARHLARERSAASAFPLLIWVYVGAANLSYSFLLEVDQFVWMLLVMAAVWSGKPGGPAPEKLQQSAPLVPI